MIKRPKIKIYEDGADVWRYQFIAANGKTLCYSLRYTKKRDAIKGAKALIKTCVMMFEHFKDTRHGPRIKTED